MSMSLLLVLVPLQDAHVGQPGLAAPGELDPPRHAVEVDVPDLVGELVHRPLRVQLLVNKKQLILADFTN